MPRPTCSQGAARSRVLIIDDEVAVLRAPRRILAREHDVVTVGCGEGALAVLAHDVAFDVVLCDLMMPGIDGIELPAAATSRAPHLVDRFLFMTGGAFTAHTRAFLSERRTPLLEKPFPMTAVIDAVRAYITGSRAGEATAAS